MTLMAVTRISLTTGTWITGTRVALTSTIQEARIITGNQETTSIMARAQAARTFDAAGRVRAGSGKFTGAAGRLATRTEDWGTGMAGGRAATATATRAQR